MRTGHYNGAGRSNRSLRSPQKLGMRRGIAAALLVIASGAGGSGPAFAQAESNFALQFAPYAATTALQGPTPGAVDVSALPATTLADQAASQPAGAGLASWYGAELKGHRTASGERFDPSGYTAAHRSLPFGSRVRVTNLATGESVIVRINDRGPFTRSRVIDVSQAAARDLGLIGHGAARVSLAVLDD